MRVALYGLLFFAGYLVCTSLWLSLLVGGIAGVGLAWLDSLEGHSAEWQRRATYWHAKVDALEETVEKLRENSSHT